MAEAQRFPTEVLELLGSNPPQLVRPLRSGPRYYTAIVSYQNRRAVLKLVLPPHPDRPNEQDVPTLSLLIQREIAVLQAMAASAPHPFIFAHRVLDFRAEAPAWYICELIPGEDFVQPHTSFSYNPSFFHKVSPKLMVDYLTSIQQLAPVGSRLAELLEATHFNLHIYEGLANWQAIVRTIPRLHPLAPTVQAWLDQVRPVYDTATADRANTVVAHNEPYPDHFFYVDGRLCLIDWENVGFSNRLRDAVDIWIRAFEDPSWQAGFIEALEAAGYLDHDGWMVWRTEIVLQTIANLGYFWRETTQQADYKARVETFLFDSLTDSVNGKDNR